MEVVVNIHCIFLYQSLAGLVVSLGLDALDFREQSAEEFPESRIVINDEVGLAVTKLFLYHIVRQSFFIAPLGNELAVLHVRLGVFLAEFHTGELHEQTVAYIVGVHCLVGLAVRKDAEFNKLRVSHIVETE